MAKKILIPSFLSKEDKKELMSDINENINNYVSKYLPENGTRIGILLGFTIPYHKRIFKLLKFKDIDYNDIPNEYFEKHEHELQEATIMGSVVDKDYTIYVKIKIDNLDGEYLYEYVPKMNLT